MQAVLFNPPFYHTVGGALINPATKEVLMPFQYAGLHPAHQGEYDLSRLARTLYDEEAEINYEGHDFTVFTRPEAEGSLEFNELATNALHELIGHGFQHDIYGPAIFVFNDSLPQSWAV